MAEQPPDVSTIFTYKHWQTGEDIPFRLSVLWSRLSREWRWYLRPMDKRWDNLAVQLGDKIFYVVGRRKPSNTRDSLIRAIEDGIRKMNWPYEHLERTRKRWTEVDPTGPLRWDGVWVEQ